MKLQAGWGLMDRRITHSYIIEGQDREARNAFIFDFIRELECRAENPDERPCGICSACREIAAGTSLDVFHMEKSNKSGYSAQKDIDPFIERLSMRSYGRYMIGIIDDAEELNETSQNKLLKTLEEPEENTVIIIGTGNRDNLLSTVCSRCRIIKVADDGQRSSEISLDEIRDRFFYRFRSNVDKKLKTQSDAIAFLGALEDEYRDAMVTGRDLDRSIRAIELIENTRMDIIKGMSQSAALKKLHLMLS